jgi:DNA-binding Lrp family transcriptional regulator
VLTGFVLILAEPSRIAELSEELAGLDGVSEVYSVTGEWDIVAVVRVRGHERLADVVTVDIAKLEGIRRTETMVAFRAYSRHDLDAAFALGAE